MENNIKMDDYGGTSIFGNTQIIHLHLERLPAFAGQRCLFIQLQLLEMGAEVTPHRDALPYGGDLIATVVLKGSSEVRVGRGGVRVGNGGEKGVKGRVMIAELPGWVGFQWLV